MIPSSAHKRPSIDYGAENQQNQDPSLPTSSKEDATLPRQTTISFPPSSVQTIVKSEDLAMMPGSKESTPAYEASAETRPMQGSTSVSPTKSLIGSTPATKKRKLSPASQDAKQQEKEARERQRLEEKAKKEEEKRLKTEEKKKRDEEREEEKRLKEEEKKKREAEREEKKKAKDEERAAKEAAKEEEKRRKEEERLKKERV